MGGRGSNRWGDNYRSPTLDEKRLREAYHLFKGLGSMRGMLLCDEELAKMGKSPQSGRGEWQTQQS